MNKYSKSARKFLKECTREEFEKAIYNAKLTPFQEEVIRLHILDCKSVVAISLKLIVSESCVKKALSETYLKLSKYFFETLERSNNAIISLDNINRGGQIGISKLQQLHDTGYSQLNGNLYHG